MFLRQLRDDSRGSAMIAVIGVVAVTAIISVTVVATTVSGMAVTSSTKASVQARAAAEAGIDRALVDVQTSCLTTYESTTDPHYKYKLAYRIGTQAWINGCPTAAAEYIRILSTGYAKLPGVAGATAGDVVTLEGIYSNIPVYVEVPQVDPAVYAHTMEGTLRSFILTSSDDSISADIQIKNGNVVCENNAVIDGSVVLGNGYISLDNCDVNGDIHVSKYASISGNNTVVQGDVIAVGDGVASTSDAVTVAAGSTVKGDVTAGGSALVQARIEGNLKVAGSSTSKAVVSSSGRVLGNVVSSGTATVAAGTVGGTTSAGITGLGTIPAPQVPDWTDLPYPSSSWDGYHAVTWSGSCTVGNSHPFWDSLAGLTATYGNLLIDARACGAAGINFQNNIRNVVLSANITFIAQSFYIDKLVVTSNTTATRNMWFLVPDNTADAAPTAYPTNCDITLTNEADFAPTIAAFVYTPCKIISDRNNWRGQFYAGAIEFLQQAQMIYVQVGVPGVDFRASLPPILNLTDSVLGTRISLREVADGN
jgi:hypothetical protein